MRDSRRVGPLTHQCTSTSRVSTTTTTTDSESVSSTCGDGHGGLFLRKKGTNQQKKSTGHTKSLKDERRSGVCSWKTTRFAFVPLCSEFRHHLPHVVLPRTMYRKVKGKFQLFNLNSNLATTSNRSFHGGLYSIDQIFRKKNKRLKKKEKIISLSLFL